MMNQRLRRSRLFKFALGLLAGTALLVACAPMPRTQTQSQVEAVPSTAAAAAPAPRLGTQWGEGRESNSRSVQVQRYTPEQPDEVASIGYNDAASVRRGVGADPERRLNLQLAQGDVEWSVIDESGRAIPLQRARRGGDAQFRLAGAEGARYTLRFRNLSDRSYEVIATVDGLDVLNGKPGSLRNGGYVLRPLQVLDIEGFRKSQSEVAAFRFATPGRAYAANTEAGDARNIGILGAALFEIAQPDAPRRPRRGPDATQPNAFPADGATGYAPPPRYAK